MSKVSSESRFSSRRVMASAALLGALALSVGGCNVIGVVAHKTLPEPTRPAAYELAETATYVRVAADPSVYGERALIDAEPVAAALERSLERNTAVAVVHDPAAAQQVVVVDLAPIESTAIMGSGMREGRVTAHVKVLDAAGRELFPADGSVGRLVQAEVPQVRTDRPEALRRATLGGLGERAATLFYPQVIE